MQKAGPERRAAPRYPIVARMAVPGGAGATIINLSSCGIYFRTDGPFSTGQELSVVLPFAGPPQTLVTCAACVVRVERIDNGYGIAATYEATAFDMMKA